MYGIDRYEGIDFITNVGIDVRLNLKTTKKLDFLNQYIYFCWDNCVWDNICCPNGEDLPRWKLLSHFMVPICLATW